MSLNNVVAEFSGFNKGRNLKITLAANTLTNLLAENSKRAYVLLFCYSNTPISIILGDTNLATDPEQGILLIGKGSYYEIKRENLFLGQIRAISSIESRLLVVEGSYA